MILLILSFVAAAVILVSGLFFAINQMDRCTPHGMRLAWLAKTTGALGVVISPLYCFRPPTVWEAVLLIGVALHIIFERRQRAACRRPS